MKLNLGINNVSNSEYHSDREYLSSSDLKLLLKDPSEFYEKKYGPKKEEQEKSQYVEGSAVHSLILEPHLFKEEFAIYPGFAKRGKDYEAFKLTNTKPYILSSMQEQRCKMYLAAYKNCKAATELIKDGLAEHTICETINEVPIKVRTDYINVEKGYIVDVKTTGYPSDLDSFKQTIMQWSYELSAALYLKVVEKFYGKKFDFYFIVISKKDSDCNVFKLSSDTRFKGDIMISKALVQFKQCKSTGLWTKTEKSNIVEEEQYEILEV